MDLAIKYNIKVPKTIITTNKKCANSFILTNGPVITKAISDSVMLILNNKRIQCYTNQVEIQDLQKYSSELFPTLIQNNISKLFELRIFFLDASFYTMAIFSQNNSRTQTDFRKYDSEIPNRNIPYILPKHVETKLKKLITALNLNSGSIDMIVSNDFEFVLLEINPVGQFGMTSYPCNYYLEFEIAKYLCA